MGYNIPGNAMACAELKHISELIGQTKTTDSKLQKVDIDVSSVSKVICAALEDVISESKFSRDKVLPYEIDGYGSSYKMDDANIPSLLSLPFLGYMKNSNPSYIETRKFVLSSRNPFYFSGSDGEGVGGPHVGYNYAWPMAIIVRAMTSSDDEEVYIRQY
jgi:meiotically up-regulated gene 157 (Mug157) protein